MSTRPRSARKAANPRAKAPEPIITRTKSAQQRRQLKKKEDKKTEKPELTKQETKSTKVIKTKRPQESLLKLPVVIDPDVLTQVEYYPNTVKRSMPAKKIMLKHKHNFKVIATTNKRKLATPQKSIKSPSSKHTTSPKPKSSRGSRISTRPSSSPELSMQDMVRMMEDTRSLSDEDFMEILTCPSPVWWEDPPDGVDEDSINTKSAEPLPAKNTSKTKKRKITTLTPRDSELEIISIEHTKEKDNKTDERFVKKKQKLENILGNLKNKTIKTKSEVNSVDKPTSRKLSESEGDFSDLSFNEEEILKNLEDMDIPIEQSQTESHDSLEDVKRETEDIDIKEEPIVRHNNEIAPKNENLDREILSIEIKKEIKDEFLLRSPVFCRDSIPNTSLELKTDDSIDEISSVKKSDDVVILDSSTNSSLYNTDDSIMDFDSSSNSGIGKSVKENSSNDIKNEVPSKKTKDLSEFITVYKITPDLLKNENNSEKLNSENTKTTKLETVRGKLNDFFKHCKINVRLKKNENKVPAIPLTDVK